MTKDVVHSERAPIMEWPFPRRILDWVRSPEWMTMFDDAEAMRVEQFDDGNDVVVRAEMPGIDPDKDVELQVDHGMLRIRAERHVSKETHDKGRYHSEFKYGSFVRTMPLPSGATDADVKATYEDGILEVRVHVDKAAAETRKIPVQRV